MGRIVECPATPVIDTAIYASGDRVGSVMTFTDAADGPYQGGRVKGVRIYDAAVQKSVLNLWLFKNTPTVASADNAALDITDPNMVAADPIGFVPIAAADYVDTASNAVAFKYLTEPGLPFMAGSTAAGGGTGVIYGLLESGGTPTYGATNALTVTLIVEHDA
jgi:hypothetical protein